MEEKVLVAYGSTNGSTRGIAETVAGALRTAGLTAEVLPARSVTEPASYEAVVVGGAPYAGRWHKDARRFVRRHRGALAERPVWFFSSGPLDSTASERDIPPVPGVRRVMARLDVRAHATFGGCLTEGAEGRLHGRADTAVTRESSPRGCRCPRGRACARAGADEGHLLPDSPRHGVPT